MYSFVDNIWKLHETYMKRVFKPIFRPPEKVLKPGDFPQNRQWRPKMGMGNRNFNPHHVSRGGQRMLR